MMPRSIHDLDALTPFTAHSRATLDTVITYSTFPSGGLSLRFSSRIWAVDVKSDEAPPLHGVPFATQLRTFEFAFASAMFVTSVFRCNAYMGLNKTLLDDLGDVEHGHVFADVYQAMQPASVIFVPLISCSLTRFGFGNFFLATLFLGVVYNAVALIPNLSIQVVAFFAFSNFRAMFYSSYFAFVAHTFGGQTFGRISGLTTFFGAIANVLIYPTFAIANRLGSIHYINVYTILLCVPLIVLTCILKRRLKATPAADCRSRA
jgi:hypothetical protein